MVSKEETKNFNARKVYYYLDDCLLIERMLCKMIYMLLLVFVALGFTKVNDYTAHYLDLSTVLL
jgi:hypothetical protein